MEMLAIIVTRPPKDHLSQYRKWRHCRVCDYPPTRQIKNVIIWLRRDIKCSKTALCIDSKHLCNSDILDGRKMSSD